MLDSDRASWVEDRRDGLGASDMADLMSEPPYGCRRKLWYEKRGVPQDLEDTKRERFFTRGKKLEALLIQEYKAVTRRAVYTERKGQEKRRHPEVPYFYHHRDAIIPKHMYGGTPGLLEGKTMGMFPYRQAQREGLPAGYILQLQWGMGIEGMAWGAYAILWPDGWELLHWDVMRDQALIDTLQAEGHAFWGTVENGPAPAQLGHDDTRCKRCLWRYTCWEVPESERHDAPTDAKKAALDLELDQDFAAILGDRADVKEILAEYEGILDVINDKIKAQLAGRPGIRCPNGPGREWRVRHTQNAPGRKLIVEKLKKDFSRIYELCSVEAPGAKPLRVDDVST